MDPYTLSKGFKMFKNLLKISVMSTAIAITGQEIYETYQDLQKQKDDLKAVQNGEVRLMSEDFYKEAVILSRSVIGFNVLSGTGYALGIYLTIQDIKK